MDKLQVDGFLDSQPFTTGVRRSMALASFCERRGESFHAMRTRMQQIIRAFGESEVIGKQGRKLWCNWSKSKTERMHSAHASWVKKGVAGLDESKLRNLEVEWNQGNVWTEVHLVASAVLPVPPGTDHNEIIYRTDMDSKAWVNVKKLAQDLGLSPADVRSAFEDSN